ncbi:MAG: hypothetical protein P0107_04890 [Nitrosomonas sp.]|nr:hypothetical protein [Nitrosomonas sp.]
MDLLFPLPAISMGAWSNGATTVFQAGLLVIGVGFLILYLDFGRAILAKYGSLALGTYPAFLVKSQ